MAYFRFTLLDSDLALATAPQTRRPRPGLLQVMALLLLFGTAGPVAIAADEGLGATLEKSASWNWPSIDSYRELLSSYLEQVGATESQQLQVAELWDSTEADRQGPVFLARLLDAAALVEPRIARVVEQLRTPGSPPVLPQELTWLTSDVPGWLQDAVRLACGRALAQRRMYDEALASLSGLQLEQVCDPSSLLFYRAVSEHHLLKKDDCLKNLSLLLERKGEVPERYAHVASLMQADIKPLETDTLDEVSRMMVDVSRRLDLGRAGVRVRDEEQNIVDKLDKMIEKLEQQLQQAQQQQSSGASGGNGQPSGGSQPMEDSRIAGGSGPGDVDKKEIDESGGWGNLPAAERQESLQRLTEELPSHYRDVIEGYFRQLAKDRT